MSPKILVTQDIGAIRNGFRVVKANKAKAKIMSCKDMVTAIVQD